MSDSDELITNENSDIVNPIRNKLIKRKSDSIAFCKDFLQCSLYEIYNQHLKRKKQISILSAKLTRFERLIFIYKIAELYPSIFQIIKEKYIYSTSNRFQELFMFTALINKNISSQIVINNILFVHYNNQTLNSDEIYKDMYRLHAIINRIVEYLPASDVQNLLTMLIDIFPQLHKENQRFFRDINPIFIKVKNNF